VLRWATCSRPPVSSALHHDRLRGGRGPPQAEQRGHRPLVHRRALEQRGLLAVVHHRQVEGAGVFEGAAHHARAGHGPPVVGDGHAARVLEVAVLGQLFPAGSAGDGPDGIHADHTLAPRLFEDGARDAGVVVDGRGVGHRAHGGEAARRGRAGAGGDRLLVLASRLPQVDVEVDEAGTDHEPFRLDHLGAAAGEALLHARDAPVLQQHVAGGVEAPGGIDDAAALEKEPAQDSPPPPSSSSSTAIRTATPLVTWSRMTE